MTRSALGIDLGNAKIKACFWREGERPEWVSIATPYNARLLYSRREDFVEGLRTALRALRLDSPPNVAVCVHSSGYSYPRFIEGVHHTAQLLCELLPHTESFLLSGSGECIAAKNVSTMPSEHLIPTVFSNGMGAVHLTRRLASFGSPPSGLVVDTGGSTTAITIIDEGRIDPAALADPALHVVHRLTHGKLLWIGTQSTPLESLADQVPIRLAKENLHVPVVPRGVPFRHVSTLLALIDERRAMRLRLIGSSHEYSDRSLALRALADAINLDPTFVDEDALVELARFFYDRAVSKLASAISLAMRTASATAKTRAIVWGQGARGLAIPALERAGFERSRLTLASELLPPDLADVASCFGACHRALEIACKTSLDVLP